MDELERYTKLYYHLFDTFTEALALMRQQNYDMAAKRLKQLQRETEKLSAAASEPPETST